MSFCLLLVVDSFEMADCDTYAEVKKIGEFIQRAVKFSNRGKHEDAYPVA
jgi:archaellum biogenesis ATPase FlaH